MICNGWTILTHPLFDAQLNTLTEQVKKLKAKDSDGYVNKSETKRLAAIHKLAFDVIPQDPTLPIYRQGNTLSKQNKHWFRAKFLQQYRLFFRFHAKSKMIVLVWVNDADSKRAYGSKADAYHTSGNL
ncbi:hypothetical protein SPONN_2488 [uncultured Candidatus Thioglobus sp.]|nr:hypothetical protein SPONN_2488 [uncultured Candidatus Thioglobus sp.]